MAPGSDPTRRLARKLSRRKTPVRTSTLQFPDSLGVGEDAQEDVTAPKGMPSQYMNQSVINMIAAAGSTTDFNARFEEESSESDEEQLRKEVPSGAGERPPPSKSQQESKTQDTSSKSKSKRQSEKSVERTSHHLLPKLHLRTPKEETYMYQSMQLPDSSTPSSINVPKGATPRDAPVMSRMLEAQAELDPSTLPAEAKDLDPSQSDHVDTKGKQSSLALRLKEIFGLKEADAVISEYPCWLLQSVLLQGYMYILSKHICFYAYLPKKSNTSLKSGHLSKRGRQNRHYKRYWFTLQNDVLSYYVDQSDLYFPSGNIDLQYGISASLSEQKDKSKDNRAFTIVTHQRVYHFRADSSTSAKEWVKSLQKVIFRSHNEGDAVKLCLPVQNVIDIEKSPVIDFAETFKIRVVDSDETYAIDEYFFSFFGFGRDAFDVLQSLVEGTAAQQIPSALLSTPPADVARSRDNSWGPQKRKPYNLRTESPLDPGTPVLHDHVRATLAPFSPTSSGQASPRPSGDWSRSSMDIGRKSVDVSRKSLDFSTRFFSGSFDRGRRSASANTNRRVSSQRRSGNPSPSAALQGSTDSFVRSLDQGGESSGPNFSSSSTQASGSQILDRSDVFHSPTIMRRQESPAENGEGRGRQSEDSAHRSSIPTHIQIRPPTRSQTGHGEYESHDSFDERQGRRLSQSNSSPTLQQLVKAGGYPLQKAAGFAGYLRSRSKKMSTILTSESMSYVEKVSGMLAGGRKHYGEGEAVLPDNGLQSPNVEVVGADYGDRFRAHFALPPSEKLKATWFGYLHRVLPQYGKLYLSDRMLCFRSLLPGTRTKMVLPLKDIENVGKETGFRFGYSGLVVVVRGREELFFEFREHEARDDCSATLHKSIEDVKFLQDSEFLTQEDKEEAEIAKAEHRMLQEARQDGHNEHDVQLPKTSGDDEEYPPILFDDPRASILNFKPTEPLRITCLTIGSRGDVQPYIALAKGLLAEGHKPRIATHMEFEPWIREHGIDFAPVDGDPAKLMDLCVQYGMFTYSFLKEASEKFRGWIDELLQSAWIACQDSDILIESPSAMAGIHIAEALGIPYFRAFTMPWTRTRAYPHAFAVPDHKMGGAYNYISYVMFDNIFWKAIAGQVNRWRKKELGLRSTNLDKLQPNKVPFLYNFSPSVVVPPIDYSDWIRVTGYWFLDEASEWTPPKELTDFIAKAREDGKKLVYIGFGSIVVPDSATLTKTVVDAVTKADVRCILSKGWSDRLGKQKSKVPELTLPPEILQIKSAPHDWLFKQIDAAAHHGGAGTTGASLRAGLPTIIKPWFGDQFFFGARVEDLGVGICMKKLNVSVLSRALWEATHSHRMEVKAKVLGEEIRREDGVATAIQAIYRDLEYAKTLIKHRANLSNEDTLGTNHEEESWTFIGDESDPELARRIREWPGSEGGDSRPEYRKSFQDVVGRGGGSMDLGA